jgi:hypothetical protein
MPNAYRRGEPPGEGGLATTRRAGDCDRIVALLLLDTPETIRRGSPYGLRQHQSATASLLLRPRAGLRQFAMQLESQRLYTFAHLPRNFG